MTQHSHTCTHYLIIIINIYKFFINIITKTLDKVVSSKYMLVRITTLVVSCTHDAPRFIILKNLLQVHGCTEKRQACMKNCKKKINIPIVLIRSINLDLNPFKKYDKSNSCRWATYIYLVDLYVIKIFWSRFLLNFACISVISHVDKCEKKIEYQPSSTNYTYCR